MKKLTITLIVVAMAALFIGDSITPREADKNEVKRIHHELQERVGESLYKVTF